MNMEKVLQTEKTAEQKQKTLLEMLKEKSIKDLTAVDKNTGIENISR